VPRFKLQVLHLPAQSLVSRQTISTWLFHNPSSLSILYSTPSLTAGANSGKPPQYKNLKYRKQGGWHFPKPWLRHSTHYKFKGQYYKMNQNYTKSIWNKQWDRWDHKHTHTYTQILVQPAHKRVCGSYTSKMAPAPHTPPIKQAQCMHQCTHSDTPDLESTWYIHQSNTTTHQFAHHILIYTRDPI